MSKHDYMLDIREIVEKHEAEYDKRYTSVDGTTYCDPKRCPMTRGEFYSLMDVIYEELLKEEDEENERQMDPTDDNKPKKPMFMTSFHGETWYRCPYCKESFEFYEVRNDRCPHCKNNIDWE